METLATDSPAKLIYTLCRSATATGAVLTHVDYLITARSRDMMGLTITQDWRHRTEEAAFGIRSRRSGVGPGVAPYQERDPGRFGRIRTPDGHPQRGGVPAGPFRPWSTGRSRSTFKALVTDEPEDII